MDNRAADPAAIPESGKDPMPEPEVRKPEFEDFGKSADASGPAGPGPSLNILKDVPVTLSLEVGRASMSVGELLRVGQGSVVELNRAVGEPLDVMVNGTLIARGEIVLVNDKFGIRFTSVVSGADAPGKKG